MRSRISRILETATAEEGLAGSSGVQWGFGKALLPTIDPFTGIQFANAYNCGEFKGSDIPELYEVRISATWGTTPIPGAPVNAGFVQAAINHGAGCASHRLNVDIYQGTTVVVPGGPISVQIFQTGPLVIPLESINVSIARYPGGTRMLPTCSVRPTETAMVGPPALLVSGGRIPARAKQVRVFGVRATNGPYQLWLSYDGTNSIVDYDSGTDRELSVVGLPVPPNALFWNLQRPDLGFAGGEPVLTFVLD